MATGGEKERESDCISLILVSLECIAGHVCESEFLYILVKFENSRG